MYLFKRLLSLLLCLLLTSCFEFSQEMWVFEDGTGRLQLSIGINENLTGLSRSLNPEKDPCLVFFQDREQLKQHPGIQSVEVSSKLEGGLQYCLIDIRTDDFQRLAEIQNLALQDNDTTRAKDDFKLDFQLHKENDGTGTYHQQIKTRKKAEHANDFDKEAKQFANIMLAQVFSGRYWTIVLHAPYINESNGELSEDHRTVTWKVPLYNLMSKEDFEQMMQANFAIQLPWYKRMWKWIT